MDRRDAEDAEKMAPAERGPTEYSMPEPQASVGSRSAATIGPDQSGALQNIPCPSLKPL
jgi:hypothetical protein